MFVVTFKMHVKPENILEISQSLNGIAEKVMKLEGCIDTKIYKDSSDENIFYFVEEWQKQINLDDHMKSSLFAALLGIEELLSKPPEIKFMAEN